MAAHRTPRSIKAATTMLERFAAIEHDIAVEQARRNQVIADANAAADAATADLVKEREKIRDALAPWWPTVSAELTGGKRKSIELGGCVLGTVAGRDSLAVDGNEAVIANTLSKRKWAQELIRLSISLDKAAILKSIGGAYKAQLAALGLSRKEGGETFFVRRAEQQGTQPEVRP